MAINDDLFTPDPFDRDAIAQVRAVVGDLSSRVQHLVPVSLPGRADEDLVLALVRELASLSRAVESAQVKLMREIEARNEVPVEDSISWRHGCKSTRELVRRLTLESASVVAKRRTVAIQTRSRQSLTGEMLPAKFATVQQALDEGWINADQAHVIVSEISKLPDRLGVAVRSGAERFFTALAAGLPTPEHIHEYSLDDLIAMASRNDLDDESQPKLPLSPESLRYQAAAWRHVLNPDGQIPTEERVERLFLRFKNLQNGNVRFEGEISAEHAALWKQQLQAITSPKSRLKIENSPPNDTPLTNNTAVGDAQAREAQARDAQGNSVQQRVEFLPVTESSHVRDEEADTEQEAEQTPACLVTATRAREQLDHDAFIAILTFKVQSGGLPTAGGAPITVLTVAHEDAQGGVRAGWVQTPLSDPVPVSADRVGHFACAGTLQRVTVNDRGAVVNLTTLSRVFSHSQRKAIVARDGSCVIPGCEIGAFWCEIHHVVPWRDGGPTAIENGVPLCYRHHSTIETSGWEIEMREGKPWVKQPGWIDPVRRWQPHMNPLIG